MYAGAVYMATKMYLYITTLMCSMLATILNELYLFSNILPKCIYLIGDINY